MKKIEISNTFKKHYKKYRQYKKKIEEFTKLLAEGKPLPKSAVEHELHGRMKGYRACKLDNNMRLIYQLSSSTVYITDIGTHEIYESIEFMKIKRNIREAFSRNVTRW